MHLLEVPLTRRRLLLGTGALAASAVLPNVLFAHDRRLRRGWWS